MIASIPKLALELGLDFTDYENIAKNIKRMSLIPKDRARHKNGCNNLWLDWHVDWMNAEKEMTIEMWRWKNK